MKTFLITIKTLHQVFTYTAIAQCCGDLFDAAYDHFGACGVTAKPL